MPLMPTSNCKVVRGNEWMGYSDVTPLMTYAQCLDYLRTHRDEIVDPVADNEYTLDLMYDNGRLASWRL